MPGFPIRTPSDHSSVGSSPRLIAASHVLHRLLMPRHSPHALNNLTPQKDARNHCTVLKHHTTNHPQPTPPNPTPKQCRRYSATGWPRHQDHTPNPPQPAGWTTRVASGPNSVPTEHHPTSPPPKAAHPTTTRSTPTNKRPTTMVTSRVPRFHEQPPPDDIRAGQSDPPTNHTQTHG